MAFTKQTLTLIIISAHIIFTTCANPHSAPSPATHPENNVDLNLSDLLLPDIPKTTSKRAVVSQANTAKAITKQMKDLEKKIKMFNGTLKKRMTKPGASHGTKECVKECNEVFDAAIDDIKNTLDSLESQNLFKANFDLSAVATNVDTCNDCFEEMVGGDPEVKKFSDSVRSVTGDALKAIKKATG